MLLTVTISGIIILSLFITMYYIKGTYWILGIFLIIPLIIFTNICQSSPSIITYPYEASINVKGTPERIIFSNYSQNDNRIIIDNYCKLSYDHWLDWQGYNIFNDQLTIQLLDNDNQFIYKDRMTGQEYGRVIDATQ